MNDTPGKFFANPAFCEYIFLLVEIERLIREGRNDDPEGEAIYEEMDGPGDKLDDAEMEAVGQFAGDLTRMSDRYRSILLPTEKLARPSPDTTTCDLAPVVNQPMNSRGLGQTDTTRELIP